ncbi:MAG: GntR family transcriptional regulator [Spirochaetales bacterium]|nr:GntR family transcriptional regulator [Spirochaetales bacterium]
MKKKRINDQDINPKYQQLINIIMNLIKQGHFKKGDKLPSETELINEYSVSRNTVRLALDKLVSTGLLYKKQGQGTFFAGIKSNNLSRSSLIGVILPCVTHSIFPYVVRGIENVAHDRHYSVIIGDTNVDNTKELQILERMIARNIDGLVIEPTNSAYATMESEIYKRLKKLTIPYMFVESTIADLEVSSLIIDDELGGFLATEYAIKKGHRRIAHVYKSDNICGIRRDQGYCKALKQYGIPYDEKLVKPYLEKDEVDIVGNKFTKELLALNTQRPTAIIFFNDEGALQSYTAIKEAGLKIPDDISVIGFDNINVSSTTEVPLTTLEHPKYNLGKWAADILIDEIENFDNRVKTNLVIKPTLIERKSVRDLNLG